MPGDQGSPRLLVVSLLVAASCSREVERRPNVLFLLSDQHVASALGCAGDRDAHTPALDRLARDGVRFANAFCNTPQCSPSRYTIWTGRYSRSHGLRANRVPEDVTQTTIAEILRSEGWVTASIGKHHMTNSLAEHGFDVVVDFDDFDAWRSQANAPHWNQGGEWLDFARRVVPGHVGTSRASNEEHREGWFATRAIEFLRQPRERPFCLWLSFHGPHTPIAPSPEFAELYRDRKVQLPASWNHTGPSGNAELDSARAIYRSFGEFQHERTKALYLAFVAQIDHNVGRVLDALDELELADDTIVVYTSDHGDMAGAHGVWGKYYFLNEEVVRVPLIARVPAGVRGAVEGADRIRLSQPGAVHEELVELVDLAPTLLELCGVPVPTSMQGRSLVPLLDGTAEGWREVVFAETGIPSQPAGRTLMARSRSFKYTLHEKRGVRSEQLFDLTSDPGEMRDVAADPAHATELAELRGALADWELRTESAPLVLPLPLAKRNADD